VRCLFHTFSSVTIWVCPSVFRVHSWVWGSHGQGRPLPEANTNACVPIQLVTYWCIDASFTGALKKIQDICKKFMTWSKFQDISGQLISRQCHIYHIYPVVYASCTRGPNGCYYAQQMATQCTTVLLLVLANQLPRLRLYGNCWLSVT